MKKLLLQIFRYISNRLVFSSSKYTNIGNGITLYSEYYPNSKAKFQGTIIFENASGVDLNEWHENKLFLTCAKQYGNLFFYDHNGLGKSPPDPNLSANFPLTAEYSAKKLLQLLQINRIQPPYILVAHSYGGLMSGYFTLKYPELVAGLLLVDPAPRIYTYTAAIMDKFAPIIAAIKKETVVKVFQRFSQLEVECAYLLLGFEQSKQEIMQLGNIDETIPVIILSSTEMEKNKNMINEDWYASQKQWLNNNPDSEIITIDSGHMIPAEKPQIICEQLKKLTEIANVPKS